MVRGSKLNFEEVFKKIDRISEVVVPERVETFEDDLEKLLRKEGEMFFRYTARHFLDSPSGSGGPFGTNWKPLARETIRRKRKFPSSARHARTHFRDGGPTSGKPTLRSFFMKEDPYKFFPDPMVHRKHLSKKGKYRFRYALYFRTTENNILSKIPNVQKEKLSTERELLFPALIHFTTRRVFKKVRALMRKKGMVK